MKLSIRRVLIFGSIFLVWCTHLIITPASYLTTKSVLTKHMRDVMTNISDLTLEQAYNFLNAAEHATTIDKQLLGSNVVSAEIEESSSMERYFFDQLTNHPQLSSIYVGGLNGNFFMVGRHSRFEPDGYRTKVIRHDGGERTTKLLWRDKNFLLYHYEIDDTDTYDPRVRPWFKKVMEHKKLVWTDPYIFFTVQKPGVTIAGPVLDQNDNIRGIVGVDIEIAELSTFIRDLRVGKTGRAFILHRNGDILAYPDLEKFIVPGDSDNSLRLPKVNELDSDITLDCFESIDWQKDGSGDLILESTEIAQFQHDGRTFLSMFTPFPEPELPWIIGVYLPEDDYLAEIKSNQYTNLLTAFLITIMATILGLLLARKITKPIVSLADAARDIEKHEMEKPFHLRSAFRELQDTADSFTRMKQSLNEYAQKLVESEKIYRAITNSAHDAIIMINSDNEITLFNPAAETMFGYTSEEITGKNITSLLSRKYDEQVYVDAIARFMNDDTDFFMDRTVKVTALTVEGYEIPIELSLSKLHLEERRYGVAIVRNITERQKAIQLRKQLVNDLHDGIGGNLSNIKLLAELSAKQDMSSQAANNLRAITELSQDCINEIRNYMNILDVENLTWKSLTAELHQYCAKILDPYKIDFAVTIDFHHGAPPPSTLLYMNVFRIIKEALNNVIKHADCDSVTFNARIMEDHAEFFIHDNGTRKEPPQKAGRGLLSMATRAEELNGRIDFSWIDGATIRVYIPFSKLTIREESLLDSN